MKRNKKRERERENGTQIERKKEPDMKFDGKSM